VKLKIRPFRNYSLRSKFFIITAACATFALLVSGVLSIAVNYRSSLREAEQSLGPTANTMEAVVSYYLYDQKDALVLESEKLAAVESAKLPEAVARASRRLPHQGLALLDQKGNTLWAGGLFKTLTIDFRDLDRLRSEDLVDGFVEHADGTYYYQAAQFENGEASYTLAGGASLAYDSYQDSQSNPISSYLGDFKYKDTGFACLLGWTDSLKLRPAYTSKSVVSNSTTLDLLARAPFESVQSLTAGSTRYYFYKKQIRRTPGQLVILFPRSEMLLDLYRSVAGQALIFVILTFAIWLVIARAVGTITRPIEEMAKSMSVIASGDYEVEFQPSRSEDEIGVVSRAFSSLIKAVREYSGRLHELSITDALTGLFNQREFRATFEREWERSTRYGNDLSLLMIDIDFFKKFNDEFGHQRGDEVLKQVAAVLREKIRNSDTAFRYGGEEFSVILPQTDLRKAEIVAEKLRAEVEKLEPVISQDGSRRITVSVGASSFPECASSREELIRLADEALYEAKEAGRNRIRLTRAETPSTHGTAVG
jgi:diguanylate cyclase (GGDEF)-like protein